MLSELLNYGKTARVLHLSQPTLSFQIKSLEDTLDVKLFDRSRQHVQLTEAGITFRKYAKTILDAAAEAKDSLSQLGTRLRLRICCGPVGQYVLLPAIIRSLTADYPEFALEVSELTTEQQIAWMGEGKVDALLMVAFLPISGMRFDPICEENLVAVVSKGSHLARQRSVSVYDLGETAVVASSLKDCRFHQPFIKTLFGPFGVTPRIVEAPYSCTVQFAYVAAGEGIAITTTSMMACSFPGVVTLPFREKLPVLQLGLASLKSNQSTAMKIFRRLVLSRASAFVANQQVNAPQAHPHPVTQQIASFQNHREAS